MKQAILIALVAFCAGYGLGHWGKPAKVTTVQQKAVERTDNSHIVTLEVVKPDGTKKKLTKTVKDVVTEVHQESKTVTVYDKGWAVRFMVGIKPESRETAYGIGVDTKILGPMTIGAFGLTSGVVGATIGLTF